MNIIKRKADVEALLKNFERLAAFDQPGQKHYFVFEDSKKDGKCTLMKYNHSSFSVHCKGASYCDNDEVFMASDELIDFLWKRRKAVNLALRHGQKEEAS